jgi:hypothetical protein
MVSQRIVIHSLKEKIGMTIPHKVFSKFSIFSKVNDVSAFSVKGIYL